MFGPRLKNVSQILKKFETSKYLNWNLLYRLCHRRTPGDLLFLYQVNLKLMRKYTSNESVSISKPSITISSAHKHTCSLGWKKRMRLIEKSFLIIDCDFPTSAKPFNREAASSCPRRRCDKDCSKAVLGFFNKCKRIGIMRTCTGRSQERARFHLDLRGRIILCYHPSATRRLRRNQLAIFCTLNTRT